MDTIYVDGQVQFTASGHTASSSSVTGNWTIGGGQAGHTHLIGKLSNFRVLNGTAQYSSTFTPPTTPLTNITNTVLLCCQSGSSVTAATVSPGTLTATGDPTATTANVTGNKTLSFPTNTNFSGLSVGNVVQREYATWDSTTEGGVQSSTFSANNLTVTTTPDGTVTHVKSSVTLPTSGKWYAELTVNSYSYLMYGVIAASNDTNYPGHLHQKTESYLHYANYADTYRGTNSGTETGTIPIVNAGDVVGILLDLDNQELRFSINGTVHGGYNSVTNTVPLTVAVSDVGGTAGVTLNAGQSPWVHEPPSGYLGVHNVAATITAIDASAPSQTTEYATWNPSESSNKTLTNGNLDAASTGGGIAKATLDLTSGKWYWEVTSTNGYTSIGLAESSIEPSSITWLGQNSASGVSYNYYSYNGSKYTNGSESSYGATYTTGDVIGIALDLDAGTLNFYKNGIDQGTAFTGLTGSYTPAFGNEQVGTSVSANFGATAFAYTPPTGYTGLSELVTTYPSVTVDGGTWLSEDFLAAKLDQRFSQSTFTSNDVTGLSYTHDLTSGVSITASQSIIFKNSAKNISSSVNYHVYTSDNGINWTRVQASVAANTVISSVSAPYLSLIHI